MSCGGRCRCGCGDAGLPCGCCEGVEVRTPRPVANRSGRAALDYRAGTHADFRAGMLARLSSPDLPALRALRTRSGDDWTIALLDAWAVAADVLTFYEERIANEGYLPTATELRSVQELARLIGYELRPGVAAGVHLAFILDDGHRAVVPAGTRARSVPGPGELPQTFETSAPLPARAELNRLGIRLRRPQVVTRGAPVWLEGTGLHLAPGDALLFRATPDSTPYLELIARVEEDLDQSRTRISFTAERRKAEQVTPTSISALAHALTASKARTATSGPVLARGAGGEQPPAGSQAADSTLRLLGQFRPALADVLPGALAAADLNQVSLTQVWALRVRASLFGHNAPMEFTGVDNGNPKFRHWPLSGTEEEPDKVSLDAPSAKASVGDWAVVDYRSLPPDDVHLPDDAYPLLITEVTGVEPGISRHDYGMGATVLRLTLADRWIVLVDDLNDRDPARMAIIRRAVVYTGSEELTLAGEPVELAIAGGLLELDGLYQGVEPGRVLVVAGERIDVPGTRGLLAAETVRVAAVAHVAQGLGERSHTVLRLGRPLRNAYRRSTVVVHGNVAHATHGESRAEVLGAGDARTPLQRFALRQPPLTHTSAPTPSGLASTLTVRVNDVRWPAAGSLAELSPADRGYVTRTEEGGVTSVTFGDGAHGARLPTGAENVRARYRNGIGAAANVGAGRITLLATKPLGVRDVVNPVPATGGADPDRRDQARENAPVSLQALDRLVSVRDYADFARSFAGIGKASAARILDGRRRVVFVTVAGAGDIPIDDDSDLLANLRRAMRRFGDPEVRVAVRPRELLLADLALTVALDADHEWPVVERAVRSRLVAALGFDVRSLGQDLAESAVLHAVQEVAGVVRARVDRMQALRYDQGAISVVPALTNPGPPAAPYHPGRRIVAREARPEAGGARPAELLYLSAAVPETLELAMEAP